MKVAARKLVATRGVELERVRPVAQSITKCATCSVRLRTKAIGVNFLAAEEGEITAVYGSLEAFLEPHLQQQHVRSMIRHSHHHVLMVNGVGLCDEVHARERFTSSGAEQT